MLYIGPFKMVAYNFFVYAAQRFYFIQQSGNESEGDMISYDPHVNKATGHPRWQNVKKRKINGVKQTWTLTMYAVAIMLQNSGRISLTLNRCSWAT